MKLSTRSRYGTRLLLDMAQHYNQGPIQLGEIAKRQNISVKYLEQIIIPLKKAHFIESVRGPKGGHTLAKPPQEITVAEIVALLEEGVGLVECTEHADICGRADTCPTRLIWREASRAMLHTLKSITLADLVEKAKLAENQELSQVL
ncbi:MAG: Rrf2 family transcriptional regulator [Syntrophobacterales bacterium]|nr:Rrf2 family transcriptional regulator [Syntrophobacterales bacterium]